MDKLDEEILDFVKRYSDEHGYPPTRREVAAGVNRPLMTVADHIKRLIGKNLLRMREKAPQKARSK
ncbi:MAG: hypothetical protein LBQ88_10985 [Treponema sp.]|jgi:SOS-response transcriptional repressor LexA|nr:hypothetical protein [Treponema sp.]